jgi:hypothetical protein
MKVKIKDSLGYVSQLKQLYIWADCAIIIMATPDDVIICPNIYLE